MLLTIFAIEVSPQFKLILTTKGRTGQNASGHEASCPRVPSGLSINWMNEELKRFNILGLCLANCYFAHDSSGFPILLLFFDAQSGRSCYPLDRHAGPVARTWWRPFPGRGVASPETPAPDRESLPATIAQSIRGGPHPCRLAGALGASNPPSPFRNCTEALDTARASQSFEQAKVPDALLHESPSEARSERTERRSHSCGRRNEAT